MGFLGIQLRQIYTEQVPYQLYYLCDPNFVIFKKNSEKYSTPNEHHIKEF